MARQFTVSAQAIVEGRELGLGDDCAQQIAEMARFAAPLTHPLGNRRYEDFVLKIDLGNRNVEGIAKFDAPPSRRDITKAAVSFALGLEGLCEIT